MQTRKQRSQPESKQLLEPGLPSDYLTNTYGRIAPQSGLAVKPRLATNAGVIDADYREEIKVVLVNQGNQNYCVEKGDRIAS